MAKINLNKEDYKIESENLYHGDIAPESVYKLNITIMDNINKISNKNKLECIKEKSARFSFRESFMLGILFGIVAFCIICILSLKLCDLIIYLEPFLQNVLNEVLNDISLSKVLSIYNECLPFILILTLCQSLLGFLKRMIR